MKRYAVLTAMTAVAALLVCCLFMLTGSNQPVRNEAEPISEIAYRMLYERDASEIVSLKIKLKDGAGYTVVSDMVYDDAAGTLLGVRNALGQPFIVEGQPDFVLRNDAWQMLLLAGTHLPATASFDALDYAACGLDNPSAIITITYRDGSQTEISIGNETSDGNSCYVELSCMPGIHLVPSDFRQMMTGALNTLHILPGALNKPVSDAVQLAVIDTTGEMITAVNTQSGFLPWQLQKPYAHDADASVIEAVLAGICEACADGYEATVNQASELIPYGLDKPMRAVAAFADGTIRDLQIGSDAGNGEVYIRMDRSGDIYRIGKSKLAFLRSTSLNSLLDHFVLLMPIQQVLSVEIVHSGSTLLLEQSFAADEEASSYINGKAVAADEFSSLYAEIISLLFDRTAPETGFKGAEICSVTMALRNGTQQKITYSEHDAWYYLAETSSGGSFLIRREKVDSMLDKMKGAPQCS